MASQKKIRENHPQRQQNLARYKPWVVDQAWETAECAHLQVIKSDAPFDWPHYPSADYKHGSRVQIVVHHAQEAYLQMVTQELVELLT